MLMVGEFPPSSKFEISLFEIHKILGQNELKLLLKFKKIKRLMRLEVHRDGVESTDSLEWQSAVVM